MFVLLALALLSAPYPEDDPMSLSRALERLPLIERIAAEEGAPSSFDPKTAAATAMVESGVGRNERRTSTVKRRSKTERTAAGDPVVYAFRDVPAQYVGEMQMGNLAGQDVGLKAVPMYRRGPDGESYRVSWDTTRSLLGDPELAYRLYFRYMRRYARWHEWEPRWMALTWKAGPGTAKKTRAVLEDEPNLPFLEALDEAARRFGITRARVYLERFDRDFAKIERAQREENETRFAAVGDKIGRVVLWPVKILKGWLA
jgi:hypothetical protein